MDPKLDAAVKEICKAYGNDRTRMLDIVRDVQTGFGYISSEAIEIIARETATPRVEVQSVISFYAFLSDRPKGKLVIRLCDDIIDEMHGAEIVAKAFTEELGIEFGETTPDGTITLERTACIGMSDQAPAAAVNEVIVTDLSSDRAREIVAALRKHGDPRKLVKHVGDGNNAHPLVHAMVHNNIRKRGPVIFDAMEPGEALKRAVSATPAEVIRAMKTARLRGRGGAGFPTGMKWEFTRHSPTERRFVLCNADEGEPGTFKDRVILTECPDLLFEGMAIAGYAVGAKEGILYLRAEYTYLRRFLEHVLEERRGKGLLGKSICGKEGFDFDIRIQMGAGAYICGEETALISSAEGLRGDPKNRPPFPAQKGYLGFPTTVNNVETFCCAAKILEKGAAWFAELGSKGSTGTKLLSVSGDCSRPGVYELPFGISVKKLLELVGAEDTQAVQVGGPSGQLIGPEKFDRTICYDDLATGGSIMVFNSQRSILWIVQKFLDFFVDESCGYCTPCRVGTLLLKEKIEEIRAGKGEPEDLDYLRKLSETVKTTSRCGLGQTAANPVLSTLDNFPSVYERAVAPEPSGFRKSFDIHAALIQAQKVTGRKSVYF